MIDEMKKEMIDEMKEIYFGFMGKLSLRDKIYIHWLGFKVLFFYLLSGVWVLQLLYRWDNET